MKRTLGRVLLAALLAGLASLCPSTGWAAPGDSPVPGFAPEEVAAAKKDPHCAEIYKAKIVVVATLDKVSSAISTETYSGVSLTLTVQTSLRGPLATQQQLNGYSYSTGPGALWPGRNQLPGRGTHLATRSGSVDLVTGEQYVALLSTHHQQVYAIMEASDELLRVARIATAEANQVDAAELALARAKPTEFALYKPLKAAEGVVVASIDLQGIAGFTKTGAATLDEVCVASLKGGLKKGARFQAAFPPSVAPQGGLPDADFLILGYKLVAGKYEITSVVEASEANLLVAAAAIGTAELAPKDLGKEWLKVLPHQRSEEKKENDWHPAVGRQVTGA